MMYQELRALTDGKATYEQFLEIEKTYTASEEMTKKQAAQLWKRRYGEKTRKPLAKELREIKEAIRDFKGNKEYAEREEKRIAERYAEKIANWTRKIVTIGALLKVWNTGGTAKFTVCGIHTATTQ